jgi:hypothetical protein
MEDLVEKFHVERFDVFNLYRQLHSRHLKTSSKPAFSIKFQFPVFNVVCGPFSLSDVATS